jgi:sRNA-binding carbon storage regulator CsrA
MANLDEHPVQLSTLCITRKDGEAVLIGDCRVQVYYVGARVRLRITAPRDMRIVREEIVNRPAAP